MNSDLTEVIVVLDMSGSMGSLTNDTIGGYNSFINDQKKQPGKTLVTTVLFNTRYNILNNGLDVHEVKPLSTDDYFPIGYTALMDAVGRTIDSVGNRLRNTPEEERPSKIIFVITTDGLENSSVEYTQPQIKAMVEEQTNKYSWQFIFMGANIDSAQVGAGYGINTTANYSATSEGTQSVYNTVSRATNSVRKSGTLGIDWDKDLK
jgi:uncharacterized protein YegL